MDNIGTMYEQGLGVAKDLDEARRWHAMAADGVPEQ
jgi:TPR repeat protein